MKSGLKKKKGKQMKSALDETDLVSAAAAAAKKFANSKTGT